VTPHALILVMLVQTPAAAGPAAPSVQDQLLGAINRGDPEMTASPTPVAELTAAAELASRALVHAEMSEVSELLGYLHTALDLAYRRTGDPTHLKAEVVALEPLMARPELPHELIVRATRWRDAACTSLLAVHGISRACATPQASSHPPQPQVAAPIPTLTAAPKEATSETRRTPPMTIAGGVLLGLGGGLAVAAAGIQAHRVRSRDEFVAFWEETKDDAELSSAAAATLDHHVRTSQWTLTAVQVLAVSAAAIGLMGIGLVAGGTLRNKRETRVTPFAGARSVGLVVEGRF
jgi:hypothetical protein